MIRIGKFIRLKSCKWVKGQKYNTICPSKYTMDHLVFIVSICMRESIRAKRLRHCLIWSLWWLLAQAKIRYHILWHLILVILFAIVHYSTVHNRHKVYKDIDPYNPSVLFMGHRQTVQIQIRHRIMRCLIRNFNVCLQKLLLKVFAVC